VTAVLFRADGGPAIGEGHLMRGLALAEFLADAGLRCALATRTPESPGARRWSAEGLDVHRLTGGDAGELAGLASRAGAEWLVVDGYDLGPLGGTLRRAGVRVMAIDDIGHGVDADVVVNPNVGAEERCAYELVPGAAVLAGCAYALIRRDLRRARPAAVPAAARVLVTFGGQDTENHAGHSVPALSRAGLRSPATVLVSGGNAALADARREAAGADGRFDVLPATDLASVIHGVGLALCASGITALELACLGIALVLLPVADNQRPGAAALAARGAALVARDLEEAARLVRELEQDSSRRTALSERAWALVDGRGVARVAEHMMGALPAARPA
jgi:spore coat polysaccharide biosynthesis predicted glycosyltransferase SpsG